MAAQDTNGNIDLSVITLPFTAPDVTPPLFLGERPSTSSVMITFVKYYFFTSG